MAFGGKYNNGMCWISHSQRPLREPSLQVSHNTVTNPSLSDAHRHTPAEKGTLVFWKWALQEYLSLWWGIPADHKTSPGQVEEVSVFSPSLTPTTLHWKNLRYSWLSLGARMKQCFHRCYQTVNYYSCSNQSSIKGITRNSQQLPQSPVFLTELELTAELEIALRMSSPTVLGSQDNTPLSQWLNSSDQPGLGIINKMNTNTWT